MSDFVIEKGIPRPSGTEGSIAKTLRAMEIDDSVLMSKSQSDCAAQTCRRIGIKVSIRRVDKNSYRVWRVS